MYLKSVVVFFLCTAFVLSFVVVLNYDTAGVGKQGQPVVTSQATCASTQTSCLTLSITTARLRAVNYTDELGIVNYANLTLGLDASGSSPIASVRLFIGNMSAGTVQGPFEPGVNKVVSLTLPATIAVSPGKTYLLSVEGFYSNGATVWTSEEVTAQ